MNDIDRQLKQALRRCEPPDGFADRVMAQLPEERPHGLLGSGFRGLRFPTLRWALAAVLMISLGSGIAYKMRESELEEARALAAKQQVMVALRITSTKWRIAKHKLKAIDAGEGKSENTL